MLADLAQFFTTRFPEFGVVGWFALAAMTIVILPLIAVVILRVQWRLQERREDELYGQWQPVFNAFREGESPWLPPVKRGHRRYLLEMWVEERFLADTELGAILDRIAFDLGLDRAICQILEFHPMVIVRRKIWLQAIAIEGAQWIDTPRTRASLRKMVKSGNSYLAAKACVTLLRLGGEDSGRELISTLFRFPKHAPHIAVQLSAAGASSILHTLAPYIDFLPAYTEMNFVSLVERTDDETLLPLLLARLARSDEVEEKAAILRAIGRVGGDAQRENVISYLDDPVAFIRIQAIKTLGKIGRFEDRELLVRHLSDPDWWIRYRAARSYVTLTGEQREGIEQFITSLDDRYARDIMGHALAEIDWCMI